MKAMEQQPRRRRFARIAARNAVLAERMGFEPGGVFAVASDLGLGGCALNSSAPLGAGTLLKLYLSVDSEVVEAEGRIVHEGPAGEGLYRIGVEFLRMDLVQRERYKLHLQHLPSQRHEREVLE
jgi:acyl-coenzyme A thioesterase PaaI-like protein